MGQVVQSFHMAFLGGRDCCFFGGGPRSCRQHCALCDPSMCDAEGNPATVSCVSVAGASAGSSRGGASTGERALTNTSQVYYRITAKIDGPKGTHSFVQAMIF